ncbi:unnamed protein product [Clavelina lepadiformis]
MKKVTFTKRPAKGGAVQVHGTVVSLHNGLLLVSTGIPSLDSVLGGGVPLGSVFLLEEDVHTRFSTLLTKYFLAEGVTSGHGLYVASANANPDVLLNALPKPTSMSSTRSSQQKNDNDMKIAFMYKDLPKNQSSLSGVSRYGHYYDISCNMDKSEVEKCDLKSLHLTDEISYGEGKNDMFRYTLKHLKQCINNSRYEMKQKNSGDQQLNVLRVVLPHFASPLWCGDKPDNIHNIVRFLHCLRAVARNSMIACLVTIPTHLYHENEVAMIRQLVDTSIELEAFVGEKNPVFKQYHGLLKIHKLPRLNSLVNFVPDSFDLAFELKRTKFIIEYMHLPPDISETASRQGMDETNDKLHPRSACGGVSLNKKLDF